MMRWCGGRGLEEKNDVEESGRGGGGRKRDRNGAFSFGGLQEIRQYRGTDQDGWLEAE